MAPAAQTSSVGVDPCGGGGSRLVRTLVIDNYDSYTYNLAQLIAEVNGGGGPSMIHMRAVSTDPAWPSEVRLSGV